VVEPATVTDGSGGSTPTPTKMDQGDAAATFTALANNTTPATTSGTASVQYATGCHIFNGFDDIHDEPPTLAPAQSYVFELLRADTGNGRADAGLVRLRSTLIHG
jgi:hypothetical protein